MVPYAGTVFGIHKGAWYHTVGRHGLLILGAQGATATAAAATTTTTTTTPKTTTATTTRATPPPPLTRRRPPASKQPDNLAKDVLNLAMLLFQDCRPAKLYIL